MSSNMTIQAALTLTILAVTLVVLGTQRLRPDLTAICATLVLILTGVLTPVEAFSAFGQPVIIIIASIYVLGAALVETGVATMAANSLSGLSNQGPLILMLVITLTAGLLSSVLSGLLVIALLLPTVLRITRRTHQAPSQFLLPLVAGATMGSLLTVIGTISNLVVSDLLLASGHAPFGFFDLTPYGLASLLVAILWYALAGRHLLRRDVPEEPQQPSLDEVETAYRLDKQLYRLRVRSASDLISQRLEDTPLGTSFHLNVLAIQPDGGAPQPARTDWILDCDDILTVEGSRGDILQAAGIHHLEPKGAISLEEFNTLEHDMLRLAELMVPFRSRLVGKTLGQSRFRERYGLNILAVQRQGWSIREDLPNLGLQGGDTLLVQGARSSLRQVGRDLNLVLVTDLGPQPGDRITGKAKLTLAILGVMLVCVVTGLLSLATATLAAAVALVLTGCVSLDRAYRSIDGRVIVLIGGMLPLAMALETTGAAAFIAQQLAQLSPAVGLAGSLLLLYLVTALITQVVSNMATAALMTPIALNLAMALGVSPMPFAIAMAVAVTTSYITPLTNTDNLMVRTAGRYTMRDYLVNNLPIFLLQTSVIISILLILH